MSGYASKREVREVIKATLRQEGRDPANYNITGIFREAFYNRGRGYGYGAQDAETWAAAVTRNCRPPKDDCAICVPGECPGPGQCPGNYGRPDEPPADAGPGAACWEYQAGELPIRLSFSIKVF